MAMNIVHVVRVVEYHRYRLDRGVESRGWDFLFLKKEDKRVSHWRRDEVPAKPREKFWEAKETYFVTDHNQRSSGDPLIIFATFHWDWLPTGISPTPLFPILSFPCHAYLQDPPLLSIILGQTNPKFVDTYSPAGMTLWCGGAKG
jgi:hypothetical protein